MNEITEGHVEGSAEMHTENNPDVERVEQKVFGTHYEQVEFLHTFTNEHPWIHSTLIVVSVAITAGIIGFVLRVRK